MSEQIESMEPEFNWDVKELKRRNWKNVYKRGFKSYISLVVIIFVFSFIGSVSVLSSGSVHALDKMFGVGQVDYDMVESVGDYFYNLPVVRDMPKGIREEVRLGGLILAMNHKDTLSILALNRSYVGRNMGEVVSILIIAMLYLSVGVFLIKKTLVVGQKRYFMERRFQKEIMFRRAIAPFGNHKMVRLVKTMTQYYITVALWFLTIAGGIYKTFEYYCVPYIVAENPEITWKQAKKLSSSMTYGYKWKLFKMHLSCFLYYIISILPFVDLLLTSPVIGNLQVEAYFKLRSRKDIDKSLLIEDAFNEKAYVDRVEEGENPEEIQPIYKLENFTITGSSFDLRDQYGIWDIVTMFFVFSFMGWIWEVMLHVARDHVLVNRGFMYGPWLPIYGAGGTLIIVLLSRFKENKTKLFILTMVLCGALEYATSFALEFFQNSQYWDYKNMFINLNGRVCLAGLIAFALGGFLGIYILGPFIKRILELLGKKKTVILCSILIIAFVADMGVCLVKGPNSGEGVGHQYSMEHNFVKGI